MSYRQGPRDTTLLCVVPSLSELHILNGSTSEFAFPCRYAIPEEEQSLRSCDPIEIAEYEDIHLTEEGYEDPVVAFHDPPDGLTAQAWIDEDYDHIIRLIISAQCPDHVAEHARSAMSMTISRVPDGKGARTDSVFHGEVVVIASPLPA